MSSKRKPATKATPPAEQPAAEPMAAPPPDLDTELAQWLTDHGARLSFLAAGPAGGIVSADNFPLPPGWTLGITVVKA